MKFTISQRFGSPETLTFDNIAPCARATNSRTGFLGAGAPLKHSERVTFQNMLDSGADRYINASHVFTITR